MLLLLVFLFGARPAAAELVILAHGDFLKVRSYAISGDRIELVLRSGGRVALSMLQVERILEDEIVPAEPVPEAEALAFSLRFAPDQPLPATPYGEQIYEAARRHALNPALVAAVVRAESAFRVDAISTAGAQGLMQLMPATAHRFGVAAGQVFEPAVNLDAGSRYLRWLADRFGDRLELVLAAYNAGEGSVDRYDGVPPYRETRAYLARIFRFLGLDAEDIAALQTGGG